MGKMSVPRAGTSTGSSPMATIFPVSTSTLRKRAKAMIDSMSDAQLRVASEFLAFVKSREADAATLELLAIPGFEASYARGVRDVNAGRTKPWRKVWSDV
jgi:hypothetical protein